MSDPTEMRIDRALRNAPLRRAPASLESRVLEEIGRRAALPWWQRSFARWPGLARGGFLVACGAIVAAMLLAWPRAPGGALAQAGSWMGASLLLPWAKGLFTLAGVVRELSEAAARTIPHGWLYGAAAATTALYLALFALGATAYRTLYLHSHFAGDRS